MLSPPKTQLLRIGLKIRTKGLEQDSFALSLFSPLPGRIDREGEEDAPDNQERFKRDRPGDLTRNGDTSPRDSLIIPTPTVWNSATQPARTPARRSEQSGRDCSNALSGGGGHSAHTAASAPGVTGPPPARIRQRPAGSQGVRCSRHAGLRPEHMRSVLRQARTSRCYPANPC